MPSYPPETLSSPAPPPPPSLFGSKANALRDELNRAEGSALKLEARVADGKSRTGEAETQLAMASEKLSWAQAQAGATLAKKEQEWEALIDAATSESHQEVCLFVCLSIKATARRCVFAPFGLCSVSACFNVIYQPKNNRSINSWKETMLDGGNVFWRSVSPLAGRNEVDRVEAVSFGWLVVALYFPFSFFFSV